MSDNNQGNSSKRQQPDILPEQHRHVKAGSEKKIDPIASKNRPPNPGGSGGNKSK